MIVQFTRSSSNSDFRVSELNSVKLPFLSMNPGLNATDRLPQVSVQARWSGPSLRSVELSLLESFRCCLCRRHQTPLRFPLPAQLHIEVIPAGAKQRKRPEQWF